MLFNFFVSCYFISVKPCYYSVIALQLAYGWFAIVISVKSCCGNVL